MDSTLKSDYRRSHSPKQETNRGKFDGELKATEHQGELPIGTKIKMLNWQQYKEFAHFSNL